MTTAAAPSLDSSCGRGGRRRPHAGRRRHNARVTRRLQRAYDERDARRKDIEEREAAVACGLATRRPLPPKLEWEVAVAAAVGRGHGGGPVPLRRLDLCWGSLFPYGRRFEYWARALGYGSPLAMLQEGAFKRVLAPTTSSGAREQAHSATGGALLAALTAEGNAIAERALCAWPGPEPLAITLRELERYPPREPVLRARRYLKEARAREWGGRAGPGRGRFGQLKETGVVWLGEDESTAADNNGPSDGGSGGVSFQ